MAPNVPIYLDEETNKLLLTLHTMGLMAHPSYYQPHQREQIRECLAAIIGRAFLSFATTGAGYLDELKALK